MDRQKVVVAEVLRTRGLRGEVVVRSQTDVPGRFEQLERVNAQLRDGATVPLRVAGAWQHRGDWVLRFSGIDSIEAAEKFRGADLWVSYADRGALAEGDFFQSDLIGCEVINAATGEPVGVVDGWQQHGGGTPLMVVHREGREQLIPFVSSLCNIDLAARTIRLDLAEGLLDLEAGV